MKQSYFNIFFVLICILSNYCLAYEDTPEDTIKFDKENGLNINYLVINETQKVNVIITTVNELDLEEYKLVELSKTDLPDYRWGALTLKGNKSSSKSKTFLLHGFEGGKVYKYQIKKLEKSTTNTTSISTKKISGSKEQPTKEESKESKSDTIVTTTIADKEVVVAEFSIEVHEYIYLEPSTGIIKSFLNNPEFDLEPAGTDVNGNSISRINKRESTSSIKAALGLVYHPWGYDPRKFDWNNFGIYLGLSLSNNISDNAFAGICYGIRGLNIMAGYHYGKANTIKDYYSNFERTYKTSDVDIAKVSYSEMKHSGFIGVTVDKIFFTAIFK